MSGVYGFLVISGDSSDFFEDPAAALMYAAFYASLGWDSVFFRALLTDSGLEQRISRISEDDMRCLV